MVRTITGVAGALAAFVSTPASAAVVYTEVFSASTPNGVGQFTATRTGTYLVTAAGGAGGRSNGGAGAVLTAQFTFNAGDVFTILVGEMGASRVGVGGDGGGGTFFTLGTVRSFVPLLVAGGGGGGAFEVGNPFLTNLPGRDASLTPDGSRGGGSVDGVYSGYQGGSNGGGGAGPVGGGGGGFLSGQSDNKGPLDAGASFRDVVESERGSRTGMPTRRTGGAAVNRAGAGGGGYSGGGAGNHLRQPRQGSRFDLGGGGGGGSFVTTGGSLIGTGRNSAGGWLTIGFMSTTTPPPPVVGPIAAVPEPASWAMMIGGFGLMGGALRRARRSVPAVA